MHKLTRAPRSIISFGAHDARNYFRAAESGADAAMCDMEDACPGDKRGDSVRSIFVEAAPAIADRIPCGVRINGAETGYQKGDIEAVLRIGAHLAFIVVPKVNMSGDIISVLGQIQESRTENRPALIAIVEDPKAFRGNNLDAIAGTIAEWEGGGGLLFGTLDYCSARGIPGWQDDEPLRNRENEILRSRKDVVVEAARAAGIFAIDGVHLTLAKRDADEARRQQVHEGFVRTTTESAVIGFDGRLIIHPSQVEVANATYGPKPDAIRRAVRRMKVWVDHGGGAVADPEKGDMIDGASIRGHRGYLAIAEFAIANVPNAVPSAEELGVEPAALIAAARRLVES